MGHISVKSELVTQVWRVSGSHPYTSSPPPSPPLQMAEGGRGIIAMHSLAPKGQSKIVFDLTKVGRFRRATWFGPARQLGPSVRRQEECWSGWRVPFLTVLRLIPQAYSLLIAHSAGVLITHCSFRRRTHYSLLIP